MPWRCESVATLRKPSEFASLRRENGKYGPGIDAISGPLLSGKEEALQGIRFRMPFGFQPGPAGISEAEALAWLVAQGIKPLDFSAGQGSPVGEIRLRIVRPGRFIAASPGEIEITDADCDDLVRSFHLINAEGVEAALKYTHAQDSKAIGIGAFFDLWRNSFTGWVEGSAWITDRNIAGTIHEPILSDGSIEYESGRECYGRVYRMVMTSYAVLPPGTFPAVPGAGIDRVVANKGGIVEQIRLDRKLFSPDGAGGTGSAASGEPEGNASILSALEKMNQLLADLASKVGDLAKGQTIPPTEETPPAAPPAATPPEDEKTKGEISAQLQSLIDRKILIGGQVDKTRKMLAGMDGPSSRAVLSMVEILGTPQGAKEEHLAAGTGTRTTASGLSGAERLDIKVRGIMAEKGLSYEKATDQVLSTDLEIRDALLQDKE